MSLHDISVDDSEQIPKILEDLTSGIHEAVLSGAASSGSGGGSSGGSGGGRHGGKPRPTELDGGARQHNQEHQGQQQQQGVLGGVPLEAVGAALEEATPAVWKLRELSELLDIRMVQIRQRWQEGRLPALGFSAEEVAHLVLALFEDTDLRRDFLALLEEESLR